MLREAQFVARNAAKWQTLEAEANQHRPGRDDPDALTDAYIELTDDLAYARTFYPDAKITDYLNGLTARLHRGLMQNKRDDSHRFRDFWVRELPTLFYQSQRLLLVSVVVFGVASAVGWISAAHDPTFVRLILGDDYVNMTLENIKKGNPLGVYGSGDETTMFFQITLNNIMVAFRAFVMGLLASVGTVTMLFYNGVMLGAFQEFFFERGLLLTSMLKIWIHGTLEISAIIIAGCAGLTLGNGLLFPGTYSRLESFRRGARQGLKIAVGLVPIFITAGFLESFVTRLTLPPIVSLAIIGASAAFIVWYFVLYPIQLNRPS